MRKKVLISGVVVSSLLVVLLLIANSRSSTDVLAIKGLADCSQNIHDDVAKSIEFKAHALIKSANDYNKLPTASNYPSEVRQGSCMQQGSQSTTGFSGRKYTVYSTSIILDVPAAKQSWKISYEWVQKGKKIDLDLGTIQRLDCP